ncbi:uncharacterized protein [Haliotis asinina]|uniref:uncharacterized protein n=1 Tax=Haliotis asinina TaxID=109174 RepID=UPI0035319B2E
MAQTHRAPKQWILTKNETINSFEGWKQNLLYTLSTDAAFSPLLEAGVTWLKKSRANPNRGFTNDGENVAVAQRKTAVQKVTTLELMLGQIANYCPVISRNTIVKNSTSLPYIWQSIRLHFGFQSTGGHFLDFDDIHLGVDERPEDLYQRLTAFIEDNLLLRDSGITHHGEAIAEDEEASPTVENLIVLTWLRLLHKDLPRLVKQRYGTELRSRTLASIKPEISQALDSLLDEIRTSEDVKVMRSQTSTRNQYTKHSSTTQRFKSCPLCTAAKRASVNHFLSECKFLPDRDRKYIMKARQIAHILDDVPSSDEENTCHDTDAPIANDPSSTTTSARRVHVEESPYMDTFYHHICVRLTLDSGATGNMISADTARYLGTPINRSTQSARQADGTSKLKIVGETKFTVHRDNREFCFEGLVVESLDVGILAGIPFLSQNDITIRPALKLIIFSDNTSICYKSDENPDIHKVRRAVVVRAPENATTIWPGEYLEVSVPVEYKHEHFVAVEPREDTRRSCSSLSNLWPPPSILPCLSGRVRILNMSDHPQTLRKNEHFCSVRGVTTTDSYDTVQPNTPATNSSHHATGFCSDSVQVDPHDILPEDVSYKFRQLICQYDEVFQPIAKGYNGASGPFQATVNMGPVLPPQRKGRLPQYSRGRLVELQQMFDDLESKGVFKRPEDVGVNVEYLNPSFLVKKPSGGFRLVTSFGDVGRYSKPQPSLLPDVDSTLRQISQWKYLVTTDLSSAFYQIPLSRNSMKYCGVATPFGGVRVYVRSAMGMPGSETALEELMCRVLGDLIAKGIVAKLADDLYCGGSTPEELLDNWKSVLQALQKNNLKLSPKKTFIAPRSVTILGWKWQDGCIQASPHRIATLSSCSLPKTVSGLRSFIGAYKVLSRVLPQCAPTIGPLDALTAGRQSGDKIDWTTDQVETFQSAQKSLAMNKTITLPCSDDVLWIVTDGALRKPGIGATMYVVRNGKTKLAGFFSAKLKPRQVSWIPCEIEALSIAAAIRHFSPYLIQSRHKSHVLTDSKPCVLAFRKLCRGEFSTSPRVSTFLSVVSQYQATIDHLAGASNVPSDFASRNAPDCSDQSCQICSFIDTMEESVVRSTSVEDIVSGKVRLPFMTRTTWRSLQSECGDLRRTHAHLLQGTRPSKKLTNIKDIKRYLAVATIAKDGLLVVRYADPLQPPRECIIIPRQIVDGVITALHLKLNHPSAYQLKKVLHRYFYALDFDKTIERISSTCHQCAALKQAPVVTLEQSTSEPPEVVGVSYAADVMRRERQMIFVLRECVSSFTLACLIEDEKACTLRDALVRLCVGMCPLDGPRCVVRVDPAPGFLALHNDPLLSKHRMTLEIGRVKNVNKNPAAERAIQELELEILRTDPSRGAISSTALAVAVASLNSRIRHGGLSAREIWTQRDQFSHQQFPMSDRALISSQHDSRLKNHPHSVKAKSDNGVFPLPPVLKVGDIVYLKSDRNKACSRSRYLVSNIDGPWCDVRKFVGVQLRDTAYRIHSSDCYLVPPTLQEPQVTQEEDREEPSVPVVTDIDLEVNMNPTVIHHPVIPSEIDPLFSHDLPPSSEPPSEIVQPPELLLDTDPAQTCSRPKRNRKSPSYLQDFVLDL